MALPRKIVAATRNPGKLAEIRRILAGVPVEVLGLDAFPAHVPPPEDGETYLENARKKAHAAARDTGLPAFADDSGLEVDALRDGPAAVPGVRSARWDGEGGTPESRNAKLLRALDGVPAASRTARFRAVVVLVEPDGAGGYRESVFTGVLEGEIAPQPDGAGGFGYDPVFLVPAAGCTVASLPAAAKDAISHRGRAMRALADHLGGAHARGGA